MVPVKAEVAVPVAVDRATVGVHRLVGFFASTDDGATVADDLDAHVSSSHPSPRNGPGPVQPTALATGGVHRRSVP